MSRGGNSKYDHEAGSLAAAAGRSSHRKREDRSRSRSRSSSSSSSSSDGYDDDRTYKKHSNRPVERYEKNDGDRKFNPSSHKDRSYDQDLCPPPPPRISKVSLAFGGSAAKVMPVQMKLAATKTVEPPKKLSVAAVFSNNDSDDEEVEQMPAECRMRMRNIGRDTPTSSGPNSFGKTKQGFCDAKKIFERNMKDDFSGNAGGVGSGGGNVGGSVGE